MWCVLFSTQRIKLTVTQSSYHLCAVNVEDVEPPCLTFQNFIFIVKSTFHLVYSACVLFYLCILCVQNTIFTVNLNDFHCANVIFWLYFYITLLVQQANTICICVERVYLVEKQFNKKWIDVSNTQTWNAIFNFAKLFGSNTKIWLLIWRCYHFSGLRNYEIFVIASDRKCSFSRCLSFV